MDIQDRINLMIEILKELYALFFSNKGETVEFPLKEMDDERRLAFEYLKEKGLITLSSRVGKCLFANNDLRYRCCRIKYEINHTMKTEGVELIRLRFYSSSPNSSYQTLSKIPSGESSQKLTGMATSCLLMWLAFRKLPEKQGFIQNIVLIH